ncbi:MAG TPA: GNAT family N-acetyltransferase [Polyangiaceae bacterium]
MSSGVTLRAATESDLDRLIEIHTACYPDERGAAARRLNFVENALGRLGDLRVAERGRQLVGHAFGFSLGAWFGGASVRALGVASVGVAPEARSSGVGAALVRGLEEEARASGAVVSILHAFRQGFYARLGYANVAPNRRLACDPRAVPRAWVDQARRSGIRAASGKDAEKIIALYTQAARTTTGWLDRAENLWRRRLASERIRFYVLEDAGYVAFETWQREPHAATRILVRELAATGDEARRVLWGFLGMQAGQAQEIEIELADDDPILFALGDVDGARAGDERVEHALGRVVAGPMIKLLDARAALAARGWPRDGEASLRAPDAFRIVVRDGRASLDDRASDPLVMQPDALASIAFGGLRARDASRLGLASGSEAAISRADALLASPPFFTVDRF